MAKALNQKFFTDILYGSEVSAGSLRLESTLSATKGVVQIVGTSTDLIINGQTGRLVHANTALRTYSLPDYSGTVLVSGLFTGANQFIYSTGPGTFTVLPQGPASVLATDGTGAPNWITGVNGQFVQIIAGVPVFADLPSNIGTIADSVGNTLPIYSSPGPGNDLVPLTTVNDRVLLSPSGTLTWSLITTQYLAALGNVPLGTGTAGQKLKSNGDGTFVWVNDPAVINPGTQYRLPFYSASSPGTEIDDSTFLEVDESTHTLSFLDYGKTRYYEASANGTGYVELRAPVSMGAPVVYTLPGIDGIPGSYLTTDGFGNLSFIFVDNGSVANALQNQLAYYAVNGNDVQGLTTVPNRVLLSPTGVPTWSLITAPYLSALGGTPLSNGTTNYVLISNGDGTFNWVDASTLVGKVNAGTANQAAYYAASGTTIDGSSFVDFVDAFRRLDLKNNGILRFYEATINGSNYVEFSAANALTSNLSFVWPTADGLFEHALVTDGTGNLSFIEVGRGNVLPGVANELAYYTGATTAAGHGIVDNFPNVASRVMITTAGNAISWDLITAPYLATAGGVPLSNGTSGQVIISNGDGTFSWVNASTLVGLVQPGVSGAIAFYPASGNQVNDSAFIFADTVTPALELKNASELHIYEATNSFYVGFRADPATTTQVWTLPVADASSADQVLVSDGAGNLSFKDQVDLGTLNALAYYSVAGRKVSPTTTVNYLGASFEFTGATFDFLGDNGAVPTTFGLYAGDGVGVNGGSLNLFAGDSDVASYGSVVLGIGANALLTLEDQNPGRYANLGNDVTLRFFDADGSNYLAFKAPTTVTADTTWILPDGDGTTNQVLGTDGAGNLVWITAAIGVAINTGTANALAYYLDPTTLEDSQLFLPVGLPLTASEALVVSLTGQLSYQKLVTTGGTAGQVALYTASQTVGYSSLLTYDTLTKVLDLNDESEVHFHEALINGTNYVGFKAPTSLAANYTMTLPDTAPAVNQVLAVSPTSSTQLVFVDPGSQTAFEKRGSVGVSAGASEVTVIYDSPFPSAAATIHAQWSMEGATLPATLPVIGVKQNTSEGFILRLSTTTTQDYSIYWQAYRQGINNNAASVFFAGGDDTGTLVDDIVQLGMDTDTVAATLAATLLQPRAYTAGTSSSTEGFILGGQEGLVSSNRITTFAYATNTVTDQVGTLSVLRSSAASIGTRTKGYAAGGETIGTGSLTSISGVTHATHTAAIVGTATLTASAVGRGSAHNKTTGVVVHDDAFSTMDLFDFTSETLAAGTTDFGTTLIVVGCNDNVNNMGYFGKSNGDLYSYSFSTDSVSFLGVSVTATTSLSSAGNSLANAYFSEDTGISRFNFSTSTVTNGINALLITGAQEASVSTFQSNGLI